MHEEVSDMTVRLWLVLSGAIAILENGGLKLSWILQKQGTQQSVEAFDAIIAALYWAKEEAQQLFTCTVKQEKPEHLPQHSGNAPS